MIGYTVVTAVWGALFLAQTYIHHKERQDLYNRLMSHDLGEYLTVNQPKTKLSLRQNYFKKSMSHAYRARYGSDKAE